MERRNRDWTFIDGAVAELGGPRTAAFLEKCDKFIPWTKLAASIEDIYDNTRGRAGRPYWPIAMMVKCIMLQKWYGLSDPQLEEQLHDRISFRKFVGLSMEDATPDETTFVKFRNRLRQFGHDRTLFETTVKYLEKKGLTVQAGTIVDATIMKAPTGRRRDDGSNTRDADAGFTKKHGNTHHGYKGHVGTDTQGIIKDFDYTSASVHDSQCMDALVANERHSVWGDSAYMDRQRKNRFHMRGIFCGIVERRVRGQSVLSLWQRLHNRLCAKVRAVVEHPFAWMKGMNGDRVRYRGLRRNYCDFGMSATAYNWKRSLSLVF